MQVGRLAVKSSIQRPHCKSHSHAGDGEQIPAAGHDWLKNLSCLCTFVSALGADWLLCPELNQWASVAPDAKRRPTAAMPVWTWSHNPGQDDGSEGGTRLTREGSTLEVPISPSPPSALSSSVPRPVPLCNEHRLESGLARPTPPNKPPMLTRKKRAKWQTQTFKLLFSVSVPSVVPSDRTMGSRSLPRPLMGPPRPPSAPPSARGRPHIAAPGLP